jgi:hypothetical protein
MNFGAPCRAPRPPLPRACPLTEIYFGRPLSSPNPCRNEFRRTLSLAPRPPPPRACMLTEIYFGRPLSSPNPCRNEFRRTLSVAPCPPPTHAEMNFGAPCRAPRPPLPRACPLTEIYFGRPLSSPNPCRNEFRRTLPRPASAPAPRLPVDRNLFRSPLVLPQPMPK